MAPFGARLSRCVEDVAHASNHVVTIPSSRTIKKSMNNEYLSYYVIFEIYASVLKTLNINL